MSFILDALRKSETDRQRQEGPALFEVRVSPPRPAFPLWAVIVASLLGLNAVVLGGWLLLRTARDRAPAAVATSVPATAVPAPPVQAAAAAPGGVAPAVTAPAAASGPRDPQLAALGSGVVGAASPDDEPAVEPDRGTTRVGGLPTRDMVHSDALAQLPNLRLDLHVYDRDPARRFVMINMHRMREGDTTPEGVHVEQITADGVELAYQGSRFLLPHD